MQSLFTLIRLALSLAWFCQMIALGADTARLSGTIQDQQGAILPEAQVTLVSDSTGLHRQAATSETGEYLFLEVPIGAYRLEVEAAGFRRYVQSGILLSVNQSARNDITLTLGDLTQAVTVHGSARMVDRKSTRLNSSHTVISYAVFC